MLDKSAISQLKQLKKEIHDSIQRGTGVVRGSRGRFGFVRLDDDRDVFLPPEEMDKVFPGDSVRIIIEQDDKGRDNGKIDKLLESPLKKFVGEYVVRGKGHFVNPDVHMFSKLLFIPPSQRNKAEPGDYIHCEVSRHPIRDGRSQVKILKGIGKPDQPGIEADVIIGKHSLDTEWSEKVLAGISDDQFADKRQDLREVSFVTIDAAETRDVDDAIFAERVDDGWRLLVAIADPTAFVQAGSPLEKTAAKRASTVYMPGRVIPMLPEELSSKRCSLLQDEDRTTMVCEIHVNQEGEIIEYGFQQAMIRSVGKLGYSDVHDHLNDGPSLPYGCLNILKEVTDALLARRRRLNIVMEDRPDFRFILDKETRKIQEIIRIEKNDAHRVVEECMLAANRCAADFLKDDKALFIHHTGIRKERIEGIQKVLNSEAPDLADTDFTELQGYVKVVHGMTEAEHKLPLNSIFSRMLERAQLSATAAEHFGLGFGAYTTFTSPLRKFSDFYIHRCIRAKLHGEKLPTLNDEQITALQENLDTARQAAWQLEQWLICQYLDGLRDEVFDAKIQHVHGGGFTVRLRDSGIEGFVDIRSLPGKFSFDADYLRFSKGDEVYQLEQPLKVKVAELDVAERRLKFAVVDEAAAETTNAVAAASE